MTMLRSIIAIILVIAAATAAYAFHAGGAIYIVVNNSSPSASVPFTALHTYYMAASGSSDSYDGTEATHTTGNTGPWATPNHAVQCGDVIVAAAGSYGPFQGDWGQVSNCPSTSGGLSASPGGVYFATLLCGGSNVGACYITANAPTSGNTETFQVTSSNWAVEGWYVNTNAHGRAYEAYGCSATPLHHIAFINDISADNLQAADVDDCGVQTNGSADYFAVVGVIAQNSAQDPICLGAIDVVGPGVYDSGAGTHYFIYGNFSYANNTGSCSGTGGTDMEDFMADTWDFHNASGQGIFADNIGVGAARMCINLYEQTYSTPTPPIKIYNNTCFRDNLQTGNDNLWGEINMVREGGTMSYVVTSVNNIAYQPLALSGGGHAVAAYVLGSAITSLTNGGSGTQNFYSADNSTCLAPYCNPTYDAESYGTSANLGTNTYVNPAFTNTADLLANQIGVPNCNAFTNTTQCMGWNANTSTLTTPSVISDLVPTASGTSGKGYQEPSTTCAANADYPTWLKGIVYLQWNGSTLSENSDLVTKPCGM